MRGMFLLELLCEEIPANALPSAREQLASQVSQALAEVGVVPSLLQVFSTCRRLALWMEGLPPATPERVEEVLGPPAAVAFAPDGSVTRAGEGFARAQGVAVEQLRVVETPKGKVVAAQRRTAGEPSPQVLGRILPHLIASLHFPKSMRWGEGEFVFVRPLHRLVALWGEGALNQVVPISLFGIRAGSATLGHRVVHPGEVQLLGIGSLQDYLQRLRAAGVEVDPQQRRQVFEQRAAALASEVGCQVRPDAELVAQHVELVEQPGLVRGALDSAWLTLPEVVVATTLRHHQKCLMLEQDGRLAPYFLAVCDRPDDPQGHVRQGNQWVAEARLADAHFFYFQDLKTPLRDLAAKLRHVAFHTQRGSFAEKAERTGALALLMAQSLGLGHLAEPLRMASQLAKADLVSHMVGEFPELQGVMGGLYAKEEGYPEEVWRAIAEQYLPLGQEGAIPQSLTGALLGVADRLDTLAALFSVGEIPSGSKDPYALRRHAFGVVRICGEFPLALPLPDLAAWACQPFGGAGVNELRLFLRERERFFLEWQGVPAPVAEAILAARWGQVAEDWALARALAELWQEPVFVQLATAFKRVRNMVSKEGEGQWAPEVLQEVAEHQLASAVLEAEQALRTHCAQKAWREAWQVLAGLAEPLDRFFVEVLVMCPEPSLRQARLGLLARIQALFLQLADISKLQAAN